MGEGYDLVPKPLEVGMAYLQPTLFGVVYASRLFREAYDPSSYRDFVMKTAPTLDLGNVSHGKELLKWLNKLGCRIDENRFPELSSQLTKWFAEQSLPSVDIDLAELGDSSFDQLMLAYESLRNCGLGPTRAAKALFAVRPRCAIPWDESIRTEFKLPENGRGYRDMLKLSRQEEILLVEDANRCGIADIPKAVGGAAHDTLAKLLDEYHWITISVGHQIPLPSELERWTSWHPGKPRQIEMLPNVNP